jgi:hypothetical protein
MIRAVCVGAILLSGSLASAAAERADCVPGFESVNGECVFKRPCPEGTNLRDGQCVSAILCPEGTQNYDGLCVTKPADATIFLSPPAEPAIDDPAARPAEAGR